MKEKKENKAAILQVLLQQKINDLYQKATTTNLMPSQPEIEEVERLEKLSHFVEEKPFSWQLLFFPLVCMLIIGTVAYLVYTPQTPIGGVVKMSVRILNLKFTTPPEDHFNALSIQNAYFPEAHRVQYDSYKDPIMYEDSVNVNVVVRKDTSASKGNKANQENYMLFSNWFLQDISALNIGKVRYSNNRSSVREETFNIGMTKSSDFDKEYRRFYQIESEAPIYVEIDDSILPKSRNPVVTILPSYDPEVIKTSIELSLDKHAGSQELFEFANVEFEFDKINKKHPDQLVEKGTIRFPSIDNKTYTLEKGEYLKMKGAKGDIHNVTLDSTGVSFEFVGEIDSIEVGRENLPIDIMPSKMDYILANRGTKLFYEIALAAIGLIYSAYLWFKSHK